MSSARGRPGEGSQGYEQPGEYQQQSGAYAQTGGYQQETGGGYQQGTGGGYQQGTGGGYQQGTAYAPETREGRYTGQRRAGSAGALAGTLLAGVLMIVSGAIGFLAGLAMVIRGGFFVYHAGYAYHFTTRGWGLIELVIGGLIFFAGFCVLLGMTWARILGVILATLGAISAFLTIPFYPVWSIVVVAVNVFIIWALLHRRRDWV